MLIEGYDHGLSPQSGQRQIERVGEAPLRLAYEDTIRTPRRPGFTLGRSYTIARLAVKFDDSARPPALRRTATELLAGGLAPSANASGGWLTHCHFLEHAVQGMMSFVTVTR